MYKRQLYVKTAAEIWTQLENRFAISNGSRKYQLNRETYSLKQDGSSISEYYTKMKAVWEELEAMSDLPCVVTAAEDVAQFMASLAKQQAEQRLFQFLNGLDEIYHAQRSQILLMNPLPTVEVICGMLQQEELQKQVLEGLKFASEGAALISKAGDNRVNESGCTECGNKGHTRDKCWLIIGYPSWHPRSRRGSPSSRRGNRIYRGNSNNFRPRNDTSGWRGPESTHWRNAANTETQRSDMEHPSTNHSGGSATLTSQQVEQLLRLLPSSSASSSSYPSGTKFHSETDEEIDVNFASNFAGKAIALTARTSTKLIFINLFLALWLI